MIKIENLSKSFFDENTTVKALKNINLQINKGEIFGIIGLSGAGKSTLIRCLNRLEEPTEGKIYIQGEDITKYDKNKLRDLRKNIGMIFQHFNLFSQKTVYKNIAFPLELEGLHKKDIEKRVDTLLEYVDLEDKKYSYPSQLSGGQKQRVAIARALINNPKVLLLDEPLGALDLKLRKQMQVELKRLQKKLGITFVYVTHDQEEALTMSDRIAVMNEGVIEQLGTPREIYDRPLTKFVAGFIGESNIFDGKVISVNDGIIYVETSAGTMKVKGNGFEAGEDIHVSIRPEHIKVSADSVEGFNLRGKIKDNIYMGTFVKTSVDLKDKTEIKYSRIEKEEEFTEGNFVNIYWNPERAVAIKSKS